LPVAIRTGFGPRFSAVIVQRHGAQPDSRFIAQDFCRSVLGIPMVVGDGEFDGGFLHDSLPSVGVSF